MKLKDFVDEESLKKLQELRSTISDVRQDYKDAASELIKGLTVDVKVKGDIDKLQAIYNTQARTYLPHLKNLLMHSVVKQRSLNN